MKDICQAQYQVRYDPTTATVVCAGNFRLQDQEYGPIWELLKAAADPGNDSLTLDLRDLRFLNSAGINTLSKFVIRLRQQARPHLVIKGSSKHSWQHKCLKNLARLLSDAELDVA